MVADFQDEFEKIYIRYFNDVFLFLKKLSKDEKIKTVRNRAEAEAYFKVEDEERAQTGAEGKI